MMGIMNEDGRASNSTRPLNTATRSGVAMSDMHHTKEPRTSSVSLPDSESIVAYLIAGNRDVAEWIVGITDSLRDHFGISGWHVVRAIRRGRFSVKRQRWKKWAQCKQGFIKSYLRRSQRSDWERKCDTWVHSLRLRARDIPSRKMGQDLRMWRYSTVTWDDCISRLLENVNRNLYRGRSDPWKRWTMTVAKNHNRRMEGRYAASKGRDSKGGGTLLDAQGAEVQVRLLGT